MKILSILLGLYAFCAFATDVVSHKEKLINDENREIVTKLEELEFKDGSKTYIKTQMNYDGEVVMVDMSKSPYQE